MLEVVLQRATGARLAAVLDRQAELEEVVDFAEPGLQAVADKMPL